MYHGDTNEFLNYKADNYTCSKRRGRETDNKHEQTTDVQIYSRPFSHPNISFVFHSHRLVNADVLDYTT